MTTIPIMRRSLMVAIVPVVALAMAGARAVGAADAPPGAAKKHYTLIVLTNPKPGREAEFNEWYARRHVPDVLAVPGFVAAQRFRWAGKVGDKPPRYRYYATYTIEADDPAPVIAELVRRSGTARMPLSDAMDSEALSGVYEAMAPPMVR